jgi:hypothetical protein
MRLRDLLFYMSVLLCMGIGVAVLASCMDPVP